VQGDELDSETSELVQRVYEMTQAAREPVIAVDHYSIDLPLTTGCEQLVQLRATLATPADSDIHPLTRDVPAAPGAVLA